MAKLRKFVAYRRLERPYTRFSKYKGKGYVKARPGKKVIKYDMGDLKPTKEKFPVIAKVISKDSLQVRANAIEACRVQVLRILEQGLGKTGFYFRIRMVPHHVLRENPLAAGAGADRLSTGMKHSFGKPIGTAAQIKKGKVLMEVWAPEGKEGIVREALESGIKKLPLKGTIIVESS